MPSEDVDRQRIEKTILRRSRVGGKEFRRRPLPDISRKCWSSVEAYEMKREKKTVAEVNVWLYRQVNQGSPVGLR